MIRRIKEGSLTGLSFKAVVIGWLVDILGTKYLGGFAIYVVEIFARETSLGQQLASGLGSGGAEVAYYLMSCVFTIIGGYVAALLGTNCELKNAFVMGCVSLLSGTFVALIGISARDYPNPYWIAALLFTVPSALFGGYLRVRLLRQPIPSEETIGSEDKKDIWSRLTYPNSLPLIGGFIGLALGGGYYLGVMLADPLTGHMRSTWVIGLYWIPFYALMPAFFAFIIGCMVWAIFRCLHVQRPISERMQKVLLRTLILLIILSACIGVINGISTIHKGCPQ